jgi:uncharacterized metal-binding protein
MSSGVVHREASLILVVGFSLGALVSQDTRLFECAAGALAGIFIGPDLDVDAGNISHKIIRKRIGWFGDRLWRVFWRPYARSFKHGQFGSHFPVFSTFVRLAYIFFWAIFVPHALIFFLFRPGWDLIYVLSWFVNILFSPMLFYGLASSDTIHYFLDKFTKESRG